MAKTIEVKVPDIGNAKDVEVIEVLVKVGDSIQQDASIITLESDKSSMEIPAPATGVVKEMKIKLGDKVSEGHLILILETIDAGTAEKAAPASLGALAAKHEVPKTAAAAPGKPELQEVRIPDIGNAKDVELIEILVKPGDTVTVDQSILTLEGEKATMEIPSPAAGVVKEVKLKVGARVNKGDLFMMLEVQGAAAVPIKQETAPASAAAIAAKPAPSSEPVPAISEGSASNHAGPAVRRLAREFGVNLALVKGSGPKARILKEDVQAYVKAQLAAPKAVASGGAGFNFPELPKIDFSKFGEVETKPLSRIKKISGQNLHRNWVGIPHITQFDEADITEMEAFRAASKADADAQGVKLTPLVFLMKAVVAALKKFPSFNSSLEVGGENLILKKYFNIGVAVDTPNGLVVPVVRDVDQKGMFVLAKELAEISVKARDKGLALADMQGGCFTISSLGGIGGTAFTPIINAPEVAILGVSKSSMKPVYKNGDFVARLMLPLSLSYDHRVIDGAEAARFIVYLAQQLTDIRRLLF